MTFPFSGGSVTNGGKCVQRVRKITTKARGRMQTNLHYASQYSDVMRIIDIREERLVMTCQVTAVGG